MSTYYETLKVKKSKGATTLNCKVVGFSFLDKESKMHVMYIPSLDISGYGDTIEEADSMANECLKEYCDQLVKLSLKEITSEMIRLGWSKDKFHTKVFKPNFNPEEILKEDGISDYKTNKISLEAA